MKLKTKYPCEQCAEGTYMTVEQEWWCDKHLMYACQMKKNRLCEKFERDGEQADGGRQAVLEIQAKYAEYVGATKFWQMRDDIKALPPVTPQYTDAEIKKMQELEQAEIQKAYELGKEDKIKVLDKITTDIQELRNCSCSCSDGIIDDVEDIIDKYKAEIASKSEQESLAIERYRDLVDYFDDEDSDGTVPKKCHNENPDYADCDQFVCSNCGIELQDWNQVERDEDDGDITYHEYEFRFCPNCGAKIVKEDKL